MNCLQWFQDRNQRSRSSSFETSKSQEDFKGEKESANLTRKFAQPMRTKLSW